MPSNSIVSDHEKEIRYLHPVQCQSCYRYRFNHKKPWEIMRDGETWKGYCIASLAKQYKEGTCPGYIKQITERGY